MKVRTSDIYKKHIEVFSQKNVDQLLSEDKVNVIIEELKYYTYQKLVQISPDFSKKKQLNKVSIHMLLEFIRDRLKEKNPELIYAFFINYLYFLGPIVSYAQEDTNRIPVVIHNRKDVSGIMIHKHVDTGKWQKIEIQKEYKENCCDEVVLYVISQWEQRYSVKEQNPPVLRIKKVV